MTGISSTKGYGTSLLNMHPDEFDDNVESVEMQFRVLRKTRAWQALWAPSLSLLLVLALWMANFVLLLEVQLTHQACASCGSFEKTVCERIGPVLPSGFQYEAAGRTINGTNVTITDALALNAPNYGSAAWAAYVSTLDGPVDCWVSSQSQRAFLVDYTAVCSGHLLYFVMFVIACLLFTLTAFYVLRMWYDKACEFANV